MSRQLHDDVQSSICPPFTLQWQSTGSILLLSSHQIFVSRFLCLCVSFSPGPLLLNSNYCCVVISCLNPVTQQELPTPLPVAMSHGVTKLGRLSYEPCDDTENC